MSLNSVRQVNRKAKNISDKRICVSYSGSENVSTTQPRPIVSYIVDTRARPSDNGGSSRVCLALLRSSF